MSALSELSPEYRATVEGASLDWLVAQYVRLGRVLHEHSANEVKAAAIGEVGRREYGDTFDRAVAAY